MGELLASIKNLHRLAELRPEIIVANNNSQDNTLAVVERAISELPTDVKVVNTTRPGKSAAINDALKLATGDYLAFLDDDVVVDHQWLATIQQFIDTGAYQVGQGRIGLREPEANDPAGAPDPHPPTFLKRRARVVRPTRPFYIIGRAQ